jgi:hypothetical protein
VNRQQSKLANELRIETQLSGPAMIIKNISPLQSKEVKQTSRLPIEPFKSSPATGFTMRKKFLQRRLNN